MPEEYIKNGHAAYDIKYYIIWVKSTEASTYGEGDTLVRPVVSVTEETIRRYI